MKALLAIALSLALTIIFQILVYADPIGVPGGP
jgi:hypothetical protein